MDILTVLRVELSMKLNANFVTDKTALLSLMSVRSVLKTLKSVRQAGQVSPPWSESVQISSQVSPLSQKSVRPVNMMMMVMFLMDQELYTVERLMEHMKAVSSSKPNVSNAIAKHRSKFHSQLDPGQLSLQLQPRLISSNVKFNLNRYIQESVQINKNNLDDQVYVMNQKSEWNNHGVTRLTVVRE